MMQVTQKDGIVYVSGEIADDCGQFLKGLPKGLVKMDMGGVATINSCGVRDWIVGLKQQEITPVYINCPQCIVMQFNMVKDFLENGAQVESFYLPTYCETCQKQQKVLMQKNTDFFPGVAVEGWEAIPCKTAECQVEPDVDLDSYLYFIEKLSA